MTSRRSRDERGAVAVLVGACSLVMILVAAFAIDIGTQRVARRDMQSLADIAALDLVRELDGRTVEELEPLMPGLADASRNRNAGTLGEVPELEVALGELDEDGTFVEMTDEEDVPTAVQVFAETAVGFAFVPGSGGAVRSAVARQKADACFKIGTYALGLATNKSALNGLLGNALGIGVLGYDGLATSSVSLLGVATDLGVGSPEALLDLETLTIGDLIQASAHALAAESPGDANIGLLNTIYAQLNAQGLAGRGVQMGELLDLGTGRDSGLDASLNLLDLVSGAAFLANGTNAIAVPNLGLTVPGIGALTASLEVIQAPRGACGDGVARTGQFALTLSGNLAVGVCPTGPTLLLKVCVGGPVEIRLGLAEAEGRLAAVTCTDGVAESISVRISSQALASTTIALGSPDPLALEAGVLGLGLVDLDLVGLAADVTQDEFSATYELDPWESYVDTPYETPQTPASIPDLTVTDLNVAGLNLGLLLSPVLGLLNPVIGSVNTLIANTLAPALGLTVAGVDIWAVDEPAPTCATPKLVG